MLHSIGRFVYRHRWAVIAAWAIFIVVSLPLVPEVSQRLQFGGFTSDRMESVRAQEELARSIGAPPSTLVVLFSSPTLTADDPEFARQVAYAMAGLKGAPDVQGVVDYHMNPRQISRDRHTVYEVVVLALNEETAARHISDVVARLRNPAGAFGTGGRGNAATRGDGESSPPQPLVLSPQSSVLTMQVTGGPLFFSEVERLSHEDLQRAELFAFPIAAVALLIVFGSLVAAGLPVALGGVTVVGILAAIALLSRTTNLSIFVLNVATMLGLGLGVDYSLFMTSRFREELRRPANSEQRTEASEQIGCGDAGTRGHGEGGRERGREGGTRGRGELPLPLGGSPNLPLPLGEGRGEGGPGEERGTGDDRLKPRPPREEREAGDAQGPWRFLAARQEPPALQISDGEGHPQHPAPGTQYPALHPSPFTLHPSPQSSVLSPQSYLEDAVARTVATAGKAVLFSGLSVFIGLAGLASFEFMLLRSIGIVGMVGIVVCVAAALTLLPAILGVLGPWVNRLPVLGNRLSAGDFWERSANWVMRHSVLVFVPTLALLVVLGIPFLHARFSAPDAYILPPDLPSRQALDLLRREFGESETAPVEVAVRFENGSALDPQNISALYDLTRSLARDPRVVSVRSIVNLDPRITKAQYQLIYADPSHISDAYAQRVAKIMSGGKIALVELYTRSAPVSEDSKSLVLDVRGMRLPPGMSLLVGGTSADVIDVVNVLYYDAPRSLAFVVVAIYLVLFLMFRSVLLPAKAVVMNTLSIIASYGALVFIFQDGHFQRLLHFQSTGTVEASMPIIMFCILFGLSMDYEVFLLSRIKEEYDRTGNNTASVAKGLEKSGKIITSAAVIVVAVGIAFSSADIVIIKALGLGIAIAVFLDATVVRTLLVPATMRLLGNWNWWAPWKGKG